MLIQNCKKPVIYWVLETIQIYKSNNGWEIRHGDQMSPLKTMSVHLCVLRTSGHEASDDLPGLLMGCCAVGLYEIYSEWYFAEEVKKILANRYRDPRVVN